MLSGNGELLHKGITSINISREQSLGCNLHWGKLARKHTRRGRTNTEAFRGKNRREIVAEQE